MLNDFKKTCLAKYLILFKLFLFGHKLKKYTGSTCSSLTVKGSLNYITSVFSDYRRYGNLKNEDLQNKTVLEIGPGDNLGVALQFIAAGAKKVVCLDRFHCLKLDERQTEIYMNLFKTFNSDELERVQKAVSLHNKNIYFNPEKIEYISGYGAEDCGKLFLPGSFDIIVSRAVLQYVHDLDNAFNQLFLILKESGSMIHKIDLRDHGIFSTHGMDPLEFLTIPDLLWNRLSPHAGRTNRHRIDFYRKKMKDIKIKHKIWITRVLEKNDLIPHKETLLAGIDYTSNELNKVIEIKSRLLNRFQPLSPQELLVTGIFLSINNKV